MDKAGQRVGDAAQRQRAIAQLLLAPYHVEVKAALDSFGVFRRVQIGKGTQILRHQQQANAPFKRRQRPPLEQAAQDPHGLYGGRNAA